MYKPARLEAGSRFRVCTRFSFGPAHHLSGYTWRLIRGPYCRRGKPKYAQDLQSLNWLRLSPPAHVTLSDFTLGWLQIRKLGKKPSRSSSPSAERLGLPVATHGVLTRQS